MGGWFIASGPVRISEKQKIVHFYFDCFCSINVSNDFSGGNNVFRAWFCNFITFACDCRWLSGMGLTSTLTLINSARIYFAVYQDLGVGEWGLGNPNLVRILTTVRNIGRSLTKKSFHCRGNLIDFQSISHLRHKVYSSRAYRSYIGTGGPSISKT